MLEITYFGRRAKISDRFKDVAAKKASRIENLGYDSLKLKIELSHENNPKLADISEKVELTLTTDSTLMRAEASAGDGYSALDEAMDKLIARLRRAQDRRKTHKEIKSRVTLVAPAPYLDSPKDLEDNLPELDSSDGEFYLSEGSPVLIRRKVHKEKPMTLEDAIYHLELIDHDFFIFVDKDSKRPAVVYRRHGYSYGVLELEE